MIFHKHDMSIKASIKKGAIISGELESVFHFGTQQE